MTKITINGKRIYFRNLSEGDASEDYKSWLNDPVVNKYLETRHATILELKKYIREKNENKNCLFLGIFDKQNNKHIGNLKLEPLDFENKRAEFSMIIGDKTYWGRGIGTEATRLIVDYSFNELGLNEIELGFIPGNKAAMRVYEKAGFKTVDIKKDAINHDGVLYDRIVMLAKKMKLALGTAQFGLDYGINNKKGKIPNQEASKILDYASNNNIDVIDTASAYGDSEEAIGRFVQEKNGATDFKIVTKLSLDNNSAIVDLFNKSLAKLKVEQLYAYLIHDFKSFLEKPEILDTLKELKHQGKLKKIGFSLYNPKEIEYLLDNKIDFDIVQVPFSILDQRFSKIFPLLKEKGVEIHVRSVFLQGLVFKDPENLEKSFIKIKNKLSALKSISKRFNIPISALCINFAALNKDIDKVIVGVDSLENLQENIKSLDNQDNVKRMYEQLAGLKEEDENIILPTNWEK